MRSRQLSAWYALFACSASSLVGCGSDSSPPAALAIPDAGSSDAGIIAPAPEAGAPDVTQPQPTRTCSADGWCWAADGLQGNELFGVAAASRSDIWAVGALGVLLHYDGDAWRVSWAPVSSRLRAIALGNGELWAVGDDATVLHRTGAEFSPVSVPGLDATARLNGVWADSAGNVWIVSEQGVLLERRAGVWSSVDYGVLRPLNSVWSGDGEEVWVVGDDGLLLRRNDGAWAQANASTGQDLLSVRGRGEDVWIAGTGGEIRHYNREAERWERPNGEGPAPQGELRSLHVGEDEQVHVVTDRGAIHTWDGAATCPVPGDAGAPEVPCAQWRDVRNTGSDLPINDLWVSDQHVVAVGAYGAIVSWEAERRSIVHAGSLDNYLDVSGSGTSELWVAGDRVLARSDSGWREVPRDNPRAVYAIAAIGPERSLIAGTGGMARGYDGSTWQDMDVVADAWLRGLWSDGQSGWLVGSRGRAWGLLNRRVWTNLQTPTDRDLLDVWSLPSGTTWAVGVAGVTLRHDGVLWALVPSGPGGGLQVDLRGVWGSADEDVWAVGTNGAVAHWDGQVWARVSPDAPFALNDVWGRSATEVWAVGTGGTILRYDGEAWQPEFSGVEHTLNAVWGNAEQLWVAGEHGTILVKSLQE